MKISACMVTSRPFLVRRAVESMLAQWRPPDEVVVVYDGPSPQGAVFNQVHLHAGPAAGIAAARNRAWQVAKGKYIAWLDDDETWSPWWLAAALAYIEQGLDMVWGDTEVMQAVWTEVGWCDQRSLGFPWCEVNASFARLARDNYIPHTNVVLRRSVYEECGGYNEAVALYEDWDMWLRVFAAGFSRRHICTAPVAAGTYRRWAGNTLQSGPDAEHAAEAVREAALANAYA